MFTFYDVEVFKHDWFAVFERDGKVTEIHNDRGALRRFLSSVHYLIGYNNFFYDDKIIASILKDIDPYDTSQKIISGKRFNLKLNNPITLDVMQEITSNKQGLSLKEAQANMKRNIHETPVDFNLNRHLTVSEIELVFKYCRNDVLTTKALFEKREDYFASKFELVNMFKLPATDLKKTRAQLSASILKARTYLKAEQERLNITFDKRLYLNDLPKELVGFYRSLKERFVQGEKAEELEKEKFTFSLCGIEHTYGLGGIHAAKENYMSKGKLMQIDVSSFYPTLMINNHFISRAAQKPELYQMIYDERMKLKKQKDPKEEVYKIALNATFGASKSQWNPLYDPCQFNNITMNGQLILTHLILVLEPYIKLVQSNTDGIIVEYENEELIKGLCSDFGEHYGIQFDFDLIQKIAQKDVNNYVVQFYDGTIKARGRFANFEGGNYERNSLTIIDKALVDYYIHGIRINKTVVECWKRNELERFQHVVKAGKFDGMAQEVKVNTLIEGTYATDFEEIQKVNRVFAAKDKYLGGVYKFKKERETKYSKVPYTSEYCLVWNGELSELDKRKIDLNWYIKEIEKYLF